MSTSETASGNTTHPQHPSVGARDRALILTAITAIAWPAWLVVAIWDLVRDQDIPEILPIGGGVITATLTILAVLLSTSHHKACAVAADHELVLAAVATLAGEIERLAARLQPAPSEAITARLRQLAAAGGQGNGKLDQSEYYQVYADVLTDLCGLRPDEEPGSAVAN